MGKKAQWREDSVLRYQEPSMEWVDSIPMGNGFLGAMVYGHTGRDKIQLNDDSLWYGKAQNRINEHAKEVLPEVQKLILERKFREAENLMFSHMISSPSAMRNYSTLGELDLALNQEDGFPMFWFPESDGTNYESVLDLEHGILHIQHEQDGVTYEREMFVSYPRRVLCVHLTSSVPGAIRLDAAIARYPFTDAKVPDGRRPGKFVSCGVWPVGRCDACYTEGERMILEGNEGGTKFAMAFGVQTDGSVEACMSRVIIRGASEVTLYLASATDNRVADPRKAVMETLDGVLGAERVADTGGLQASYDQIRAEHTADFSAYMKRCHLDLPTDLRAARYFRYARYLLVSSSREGSAATNLQGIWNREFTPSWDSKHTLNINQEMNYWPLEVCNLSELHEPQFELIHKMESKGEDCAKRMYGCRGAVFHHNTDFYGDCGTQDVYSAATFWPMGGPWMAMHIWEHYRYTGDLEFLRGEYPLMQKLVLFYLDFLMEDKDGWLVTCPSVSPENRFVLEDGSDTPICAGPAMDRQLLRAFFRMMLKAADLLGIEDPNRSEMERVLTKLKPDGIDSKGRLMEWADEEVELTPDMGHVSHLWGAFPGEEITDETPELLAAARKSLESRIAAGANRLEWPGAWQLSLFARFHDGKCADETLQNLLDKSLSRSLLSGSPVFQIDANMGILAGMAECLLQSHQGIEFLPALPESWKCGSVSGLKARGNLTVDLTWSEGKLQTAVVTPAFDGVYEFRGTAPKETVVTEDALTEAADKESAEIARTEHGYRLTLKGGRSYELKFE